MLPGDEPHVNRRAFLLEEGTVHLNHGSFGAATRAALAAQDELRRRMDGNPMRFFTRELVPMLDEARERAAAFVGASAATFAFVPNATFAVNSVVSSLALAPGDELLTTSHTYNACTNVLRRAAESAGAKVVVAEVPFPIHDEREIIEPVLALASSRTRLALLDHVTSRTALVFPIERLVHELEARGVPTIVDGAHAPGMVDLDVARVGAAYYTGNFHKWPCAPKGAAFLAARPDHAERLRPVLVSHGANFPTATRSRFRLEFDWTGTTDPTPWLSIPAALDALGELWPGGLPALRARNHALALRARAVLAPLLAGADAPPPAPPELIGWMASIPVREIEGEPPEDPPGNVLSPSSLQRRLAARRVETVVFCPSRSARILRVSAHAYTTWADIEALKSALETEGFRESEARPPQRA